MKSANIELLKGFPKLEIVEFDGAKSTDDDVVKVTELPASLKEFRVAGLGTRTMPVTRRGWDAIAKLPVTTLYFASPVISSEGFAALGTMQNVEELSLYASGFAETDLAALSSLAKLNQLNLQNTTLTDKAIPIVTTLIAGLNTFAVLIVTTFVSFRQGCVNRSGGVSIVAGDACPACQKGTVYEVVMLGMLIRFVGQASVQPL